MDNHGENIQPTNEENRLHHIDQLRGFALFGIFLVNMILFQYGMFGSEVGLIPIPFGKVDQATHWMIQVFFENNFYPIFSFLFGFGAILLMNRSKEIDGHFRLLYMRRMTVLFFIGVSHLFFIWDGDILLTYAITGFLFFLFLKCRPFVILLWVVVIAVFLNGAAVFSQEAPPGGESIDFSPYAKQEQSVLSEGSYSDVLNHRLKGDPLKETEMNDAYSLLVFVTVILKTLMLFLLGAFFAKKGWLHTVSKYKTLWKALMIYTGFFGLIMKLLIVSDTVSIFDSVSDSLAGPLLGLSYISLFVLNGHRLSHTKMKKSLERVGRMALTNYLIQSALMTTVFYGYGLGWFAQLGVIGGATLVVVVFSLQMTYSYWWLERFSHGPVEWLWRKGAYVTQPSIKRESDKDKKVF
ncbi:DUF418 domain-containing protein [Texcoconibacillus texcoconensis]|nr:DUF418 domain-containing protein [Texcoconibacillus texcoconensis]